VDYIKHIEIPKVHLCCGQVMILHRIFFMNFLFFVTGAYRCHTGCFGLTVVRNVNGIDSLGHAGICGRVLQLIQMWTGFM